MYGWRARIGLVVPSVNTVLESEFHRYVPDGVSVHSTRMPLESGTIAELTEMSNDVERCGELLRTADVDVVAYGCTTGSLVNGYGYDTRIEERLAEAAGVPAIAAAASIKRAFRALDLQSLAITTPYHEELNDREQEFLTESGFDVVAIHGLNLLGTDIGATSPETAYGEAKSVDHPDADGIFISCTDYRTFEVISALERDLNKPIVSSNLALFWDALGTVGVEIGSIGVGTLLTKPHDGATV